MKRIKILLVDDQQLFVENLRIVMESRTDDMEVVGVAADGREAIDFVDDAAPDVVLMDVRMPGIDGVEATRTIHESHPDVRIIMLTTFDNDEYVHHALQYGAVGYILKNIPPEELFASVRAVVQGAVLMSPSVAQRLVQIPGTDILDRVGKAVNKEQALELYRNMTERECEIIGLIARAYSNKDIAGNLGIAEQTVKNHLSQIFDKLGVFRRTELMRMFRDFTIEDFQI
ncbi:MAG: response regulator transcription factor [Spirochaetales bacterium]|jgi:DNA-binding NarL/FixJ family response regulator|nr:response regulator transcription factor [Spirochaetales bacterium]